MGQGLAEDDGTRCFEELPRSWCQAGWIDKSRIEVGYGDEVDVCSGRRAKRVCGNVDGWAAGKCETDPDGDYGGEGPNSLRSPSAKRRGKRGARRKDKSQPLSTPSVAPSFSSLLDTASQTPADSYTSTLPEEDPLSNLAAAIQQSTAEISRSTSSDKAGSVASSRTGCSSCMIAAAKAMARLPPMPLMPHPLPPGTASVEHYRDLGRQMNSIEMEVPARPPQQPVNAAYIEEHAGVAAILSSPPALPKKVGWRDSASSPSPRHPTRSSSARESRQPQPSSKLRNEVPPTSTTANVKPSWQVLMLPGLHSENVQKQGTRRRSGLHPGSHTLVCRGCRMKTMMIG